MNINLSVIAGTISTVLFALSTLPMVRKAYRTKNLESYSLGYLLLGNVGNLFYSIYVFNLPPGPIWVLHTFYLIVTGLMLFWYLRYEWWPAHRTQIGARIRQFVRRAVHRLHALIPGYPAHLPHSGHDRVHFTL